MLQPGALLGRINQSDIENAGFAKYGRLPDYEGAMPTEHRAEMTDFSTIDELAAEALTLWDLPPDAKVRRINVSENLTYLVEAPEDKAVLRVHRPGYHSLTAIQSELAWSAALKDSGLVSTPSWRRGRDGEAVQHAGAGSTARRMVLFDFAEGAHPTEDGDNRASFEELGEIAARTHLHAAGWARPSWFERHAWDLNAVFGPNPIWGDWRAAPNLGPSEAALLERLQQVLTARLSAFGAGLDRYGLIHGDMRLANVLIGEDGPTLIDFDDCGFGWRLYDFAAAISFIEDSPSVPDLKAAWLTGYRTVTELSAVDEAELDSFVLLRRITLLAWIGSHMEATEPQALAPHFAAGTARLAEDYLSRFG